MDDVERECGGGNGIDTERVDFVVDYVDKNVNTKSQQNQQRGQYSNSTTGTQIDNFNDNGNHKIDHARTQLCQDAHYCNISQQGSYEKIWCRK